MLYPRLGQAIGVQIRFTSPGYLPLAQLVEVLKEAHVDVKEMAVGPGEDDKDTIHLLLKLPRGLDKEKLTGLVADLDQVRSVKLD